MNWLAVLSIIGPLIQMIPQIRTAWETTTSGGLAAIVDVIKGSPIITELEQIGAALFPKLSPSLHAAAAALVLAHPNNTTWLQSALNVIKASGYVNFGADLAVDGIYGPKTFAAVEAIQTKLKLPTTGFVADLEYNSIAALLTKL